MHGTSQISEFSISQLPSRLLYYYLQRLETPELKALHWQEFTINRPQ